MHGNPSHTHQLCDLGLVSTSLGFLICETEVTKGHTMSGHCEQAIR